MADKGVVNIGLRVDYEKSLKQMESNFKSVLREIKNDAKRSGFSNEIAQDIAAIEKRLGAFETELTAKFEKINSQKLNASEFVEFQTKVDKSISGIDKSISSLTDKLNSLGGSDATSGLVRQFEDLKASILSTFPILKELVEITGQPLDSAKGIDSTALESYKATLKEIRAMRKEMSNLDFGGSSDDALFDKLTQQEELLTQQVNTYKELKAEMSETPKPSPELENNFVRAQVAVQKTIETIETLDGEIASRNLGAGMEDSTATLIKSLEGVDERIDKFVSRAQGIVQANAKIQASNRQVQETFSTFQIKDGAIHVPVDIVTKNGDIKKQVEEIVAKAQAYADGKPIIARVRLTLDGDSSKGYKKSSDIAKQIEDGQNEPAIDISKSIKKTYTQAVREAEKVANDAIKAIKKTFDSQPIKLTFDKEAFISELSETVNSSLGKIASDSTGLNVNSELEALIGNLQKVSETLSGSNGVKLGLDEAQINRVTAAIENMANMIQRAFSVASDADIANQWGVIESKFRSVAGEGDKLLRGNKEHLAVMHEIAVEYQKYLDMGGKNDFSALTNNTRTVKNLTKEYENLGKAVEEANKKQEQQPKQQPKQQPTAPTVSKEDKEAIKGVNTANKSLEGQAGKTATAIENEAKVAQSAAEKFRKLAKEKGATVATNRELAKAAKETADALEREAKARKDKEKSKRSSENAVDSGVYLQNSSQWQESIRQSLSGIYEEVYGAKISQAANGVVKFTAYVRELDGQWKVLTATVDEFGNIASPKIQDATNKQVIAIERQQEAMERYRAAMIDAEDQPEPLDKTQMDVYSEAIRKAGDELDKFKIKKISIDESGHLSIATEFKDASGQVSTFTAQFNSVEDIIDTTTGKVVNLGDVLESAFSSGKFTVAQKTMSDLQVQAERAANAFEAKHQGSSYFEQIRSDFDKLKADIANINDQSGLDAFKARLASLNDVMKDNKLGKLLGTQTFTNIGEAKANIESLLSSIGKVNTKSIRVSGADKLTAEVRLANGEIHKMNVSLDSKGFARYVDAGIVQFGRLRSAAEGVFKRISDMTRIYISPYRFIQYFRQGLDKVKEMDTALTELRKVSDAPLSDIGAYFDDAVVSAKELGSSVKEMINATAD